MDIANLQDEKVKNIAVGTSTVPTASVASNKSDNNSIIAIKKPKEDILRQLGITAEQYIQICNNNPAFETLSLDKQLEYIRNSQTKGVAQPLSPANDESTAEVSQAVENQQSPVQKSDDKAQESLFFNKADYVKLPLDKKISLYVEEYAKNVFMFADNNNPKTAEDWDALSDEEKTKLLNSAKEGMNDRFAEVLKTSGDNKDLIGTTLDILMTDLQAANAQQLRVKQFYGEENYFDHKYTQAERDSAVYSYLNEVQLIEEDMNLPSSLSKLDKARLDSERLLANSVGKLIGQENMCPDDARRYLKENNISEYEVELEYLRDKKKNGKLSEFEKAKFKQLEALFKNPAFNNAFKESKYQGLQRLKADYEAAVKSGNTSLANRLNAVINSDDSKAIEKWAEARDKKTVESPQEYEDFKNSAFGKLYQNAPDAKAKAAIMAAYIHENVPKDKRAEVSLKFSQGLEAEGPDGLDTHIKFMELVFASKKDDKMANKLAQCGNASVANLALDNTIKDKVAVSDDVISSVQQRNVDSYNSAKTEEAKTESRNVIIHSSNVMREHGSAENKAATVDNYSKLSSDDKIGISLNDLNYSNEDDELQRKGFDSINQNASDKVKEHGALNAYKAAEGNQNYALSKYTYGSKAATKAAAEAGVYTKFAEKEQIEGMKTTNQRIEENFEGQEKIDLLVISADYIKDASASNQLEMHKLVMNSEYDEVLQRASSNINKYDKSVQADAIRASYNTGNQKAIDAVNAQLELCDKAAVDSVAEVSDMLAKTEKSSNEQVVKMVADLNSDYKSVTGNDIEVYDTEGSLVNIVSAFKTAVENNDTQRQIQLLGKIPSNMLSSAISQISMYNVNLLSTFVKLGRGSELLKIPGMSSDLTSKVIHLMLNSSMKDQKYAAKYVMDNKNYFAKSTLERCQKLLDGSSLYSSTPIGGVKTTFQPGMSAIYPNKKEMFYKA